MCLFWASRGANLLPEWTVECLRPLLYRLVEILSTREERKSVFSSKNAVISKQREKIRKLLYQPKMHFTPSFLHSGSENAICFEMAVFRLFFQIGFSWSLWLLLFVPANGIVTPAEVSGMFLLESPGSKIDFEGTKKYIYTHTMTIICALKLEPC